jgi:biofilm PGA synthesis N-glycosyltransferase PgaC
VIETALGAVVAHPAYIAAMVFLGSYPIATSLYWSVAGSLYNRRRERPQDPFFDVAERPFVSVIVAARDEEAVIEETLTGLLELDWPRLEVLVVDDASSDGTQQILRPYAEAGLIRLVRKEVNEGKAMALNDALPLVRGEFILVVDADGRPRPDVLRWMIPHFVRCPRVAAVTGNPRVANPSTLLARLQALEFSATVSVLRRAQATWGRLMTFSGICTAFRLSAVESVGRFPPEMATEDIALAWELQRAHYDIRYEPRAVFAMQVPATLGGWWRQRSRWARGLAQVLRRHAGIFRDHRQRRQWPVYAEAALSILWATTLIVAVIVWVAAYAVGTLNYGANPVPNFWGMLIAAVGMVQILFGLTWDARYDPAIRRSFWWIPLYPLLYWMLAALVTVWATPRGLFRRPSGTVTWSNPRRPADAPAGRTV